MSAKGEVVVDTGYLVDKTLKGGRVGLYVFSQSDVTWKHLSYKSNGRRALVSLFQFICSFISQCSFSFCGPRVFPDRPSSVDTFGQPAESRETSILFVVLWSLPDWLLASSALRG